MQFVSGPVIDLFWPRLTGPTEKEPSCPDSLDASHRDYLDDLERHLPILSTIREERSRTVDRKLLALLTLTAIFSAAVTASLVAAATIRTSISAGHLIVVLVTFVIYYILVQLLCSLLATLKGLVRREYQVVPLEALSPLKGENNNTYRTRLINLQIQAMYQNEWAINQKVSQMAVAHRALKNALGGALLLLSLAAGVAILQVISPSIV